MATYVWSSTFFRPSLDHHNVDIQSPNSTYLTWMRDPKFVFGVLGFAENLFNYSVANNRLLFISTTKNTTFYYPPVASTTTARQSRVTPLYLDKTTLSGDDDNQWSQIETLLNNNLTADVLIVYASGSVNIAYVCSQYRSGTTNASIITVPSNKKLVNVINDTDKLFRHIKKADASSAYNSSDIVLTKITKGNESFLLQTNYKQIWLDAGSYLFEQLYTTNITSTTNTDGETVVSATLNRIQKNVTVDSNYTVPMIVDMRS